MAPRLCLASWLLCASVMGQGQAALQMVDGHPILRATLRSGDNTYEAHLLLDLSLARDLVLHPMAADALSATVDLRSGGVHLPGLEVESRTDEWLVEMTRQHAQALGEVPLVGMVACPPWPPTPWSSTVPADSSGCCRRRATPGRAALRRKSLSISRCRRPPTHYQAPAGGHRRRRRDEHRHRHRYADSP